MLEIPLAHRSIARVSDSADAFHSLIRPHVQDVDLSHCRLGGLLTPAPPAAADLLDELKTAYDSLGLKDRESDRVYLHAGSPYPRPRPL